MADLTKTVKVLFQGEDDISPTLKSITGSVDKFSAGIESIADPFAKITDGVLALDAALITLVGTGLALALKASADFESSSVSLAKILGDEVDQIGAVESAVIELSNQYGRAATDVLDSTTDFKRAGFSVADSLLLTEKGIGLVIGAAEAELDVARSTEIIIAALKGFNAPAQEAGRLTDILNKVSNEYATSVVELGTGLAALAPIAKLSGLSFEETAAVLTPVIEVFRSGDEAAIALKKGLLSLISDQAPVKAALESIGVAQKDQNGALRSGRDILFDVAEAFKTTDENAKLFVASELVGIQQAGRLVTVFDSLQKVTEITGTALAANGSIQKEVNAVLATSTVAVERFASAFVNLGIAVGNEFRAAAKEAIDGGTDIEIALQQIIDGDTFLPVFDAIRGFAGDLGALLSQIAEDLPEAFEDVDFNGLIKALGGVADEFIGLFDGIDLTTPEGIAEAIQGVVDSLTLLANITAGIVESFGPTVEFLRGLISSTEELDGSVQKQIGNLLGAAKIVTEFGLKTAAAIVLIGDSSGDLGFAFELVARTVTSAFRIAVGTWEAAKLAVLEVIDILLQASDSLTFGVFNESINESRKLVNGWKNSVQNDLVTTAEKAVKSATGIDASFDALRVGAEGSAKSVSGGLDDITLAASHAADSVDSVGTAVSDVTDKPAVIGFAVEPGSAADAVAKALAVSEGVQGELDSVTGIEIPVDTEQVSNALAAVPEAVDEVQRALDERKLTIRLEEILAQGDIDLRLAEIQTGAENLQAALEFQTEFNIASLEADTETTVAAFESISDSVVSTGETIASLTGSLAEFSGNIFGIQGQAILTQLNEENRRRDEALQSQRELNDAQTELIKARTESLNRGDGAIKVEVNGGDLAPGLDFIMTQVFQAAQIRIVEENAEYQALLGQPI